MNEKSTSWGGVASWYDDLLEESDDSYQAKVILPNLNRILDPKPGMKILDIACGQGFFARAFAAAGAKVSACDISEELISIAKSRNSKGAVVEYAVSAAHYMKAFKDGAFDAAVIVLAVQNIDNLAGTFQEASRALKAGGRFVIVLNHPAFRIPKDSSWEWSDTDGRQYRRVDSYMSDARIEMDMTPGEKNPKKKKMTYTFHRPLQSYFKFLNKSGFSVARLEEWISHKQSQKGPRSAEEDRMRKEIPMFIMIEAVKN